VYSNTSTAQIPFSRRKLVTKFRIFPLLGQILL
jgi:hypothetical protein